MSGQVSEASTFSTFPTQQKLKTPWAKVHTDVKTQRRKFRPTEPPELDRQDTSTSKVFASTLEETMAEDSSDSLEAQKVPRCTPEAWREEWMGVPERCENVEKIPPMVGVL